MLSGVARGFLNSVAGHESGGGADLAALEARIDASTPDPLPFYKWKSAVILDPIQGSGSGSTLVAKLPLSQVCKWMTLQTQDWRVDKYCHTKAVVSHFPGTLGD